MEFGNYLDMRKIPEIHSLATLLTENKKKSLEYQVSESYFTDFWRCGSHMFHDKFTLNLCDTHVFKN